MKTVKQFLDSEWYENSGHGVKQAILDNIFDRIGSYYTYSDIEGVYMAVISYWEHNVEDMIVKENNKWYGIELSVDIDRANWLRENYGNDTIRLVVPQWVMNKKVNDFRHAKNLFRKMINVV